MVAHEKALKKSGNLLFNWQKKITGDIQATVPLGSSTISLEGKLTRLNGIRGTATIDEETLGVHTVDVRVSGIALVTIDPVPIPLPLPFRLTAEVVFDAPYPLFALPYSDNRENALPTADITIDASIGGIFGIIKQTFDYPLDLGAIPYEWNDETEIEVEAGSFDAYKVVLYNGIGTNYFAPEVGNVIKTDIKLEGVMDIQGELSSSNYQ